MRSLWAGVSGLNAHQTAMDVEGNNIANVNTAGFKYSRVNFSDLLSQTSKIATAPQGELGGKNPTQVGLGTQVSSITTMYKQGSIQTTDKNTDLAIQGDGFFVLSSDGGKTYDFSRNGDFVFDAKGNFVDSNGYIVQGWNRDDTTGDIDSTAPISNITIPPGLTTPANASSYVNVKANLNSGNTITNKSPIYTLDSKSGWVDKNGDDLMTADEVHSENDMGSDYFNSDKELSERAMNFGVLFNSVGEAFDLQEKQGTWISYADAKNTQTISQGNGNLDITLNGTHITGDVSGDSSDETAQKIATLVNQNSSKTGITATVNGSDITFTNNNNGTTTNLKNIDLKVNEDGGSELGSKEVYTAYQYQYVKSGAAPIQGTPAVDEAANVRTFTTTEDLREAMQHDARLNVNYDSSNDSGEGSSSDKNDGVKVTVGADGKYQIENPKGDALNSDDGDIITTGGTIAGGTTVNEDILFKNNQSFADGDWTNHTGADIVIPADSNSTGADITVHDGDDNPAFTLTKDWTMPSGTGDGVTFNSTNTNNGVIDLEVGTNYLAVDDYDMNLKITSITDETNKISANEKFTTTLSSLQGSLPSGNTIRISQGITAANHASSIDIFDSLGSKHTVRFEFTKTGYTADGGTQWNTIISVPEPGVINTAEEPHNIVTGQVIFNSDGSLSSYTPTNLTYTANNGSSPNQNINLQFGTTGQFNGMTSFDATSNTSGISQDGYPGGDLNGIRVDETGTLIGSFTNGRSFGLAQVSMASFANNEGLESAGGGIFIQTSNSGDPIIGQAATGKRGFIQASSLEMSNVDLSRSLTQLIVIQRGYQANSKTITTSDEMLQTLLQLK